MPTKLIFGPGKVSLVGEFTKQYGKKALIVTGKSSTKKTGLLDRVIKLLEKEEVSYVLFDSVPSNPLTTTALEGAEIAKKNGCDVVLALGGGSAMDAAKGIAFSAINSGDISEYIFGKQGIGALPIIAVTTTAGTGSEGDSLAVLTNPENNDKKSLKSPFIYPKVSIIDPELMTTLPKRIIASTVLDALCHCMEAYVANNSNVMIEALALKAISLISKNIFKVYENPADVEAWNNIAIANTIGGMSIDCCGVALAHGLEHPVSGLLNVSHGEGLAAILIPWMVYSYESAPEKFAKIAEAFGEDLTGLNTINSAKRCICAMSALLDGLDLKITLEQLGVKEEHIDWLSNNAMKTMTYAIGNNPKVAHLEDIKALYKQCL